MLLRSTLSSEPKRSNSVCGPGTLGAKRTRPGIISASDHPMNVPGPVWAMWTHSHPAPDVWNHVPARRLGATRAPGVGRHRATIALNAARWNCPCQHPSRSSTRSRSTDGRSFNFGTEWTWSRPLLNVSPPPRLESENQLASPKVNPGPFRSKTPNSRCCQDCGVQIGGSASPGSVVVRCSCIPTAPPSPSAASQTPESASGWTTGRSR